MSDSFLWPILNHTALRRLAGERAFVRGEDYYREGRVRSLVVHGETLTGRVQGEQEYEVCLRVEGDRLEGSCTCPGRPGRGRARTPEHAFCKHRVAVALAWLAQQGRKAGPERAGGPLTLPRRRGKNPGSMRSVDKPWGHELIWAETERYVGKILHIRKGERLSLQYHQKKDETVMVLSGRLCFEHYQEGQERQSIELGPRQPFHVCPGTRHRMIALEDTDVLEVSTPELEDVVRLEDSYGRVGTSSP